MKKKIEVIAEIGVNHNGSIFRAKRLIDEAKKAGADYAKFQYYKTEELSTKYAKKADYQILKSKKENQFNMLKKYELSLKKIKELKQYSKKKKIKFLVSAFDKSTLRDLKKMNTNIYKIPSGEITNIPYLELIASFKKKIILSTGMSTLKEITKAVNTLYEHGLKKKDLVLMQCTSNYPTKINNANLDVIKIFKKKFKINIGFSDHTKEIETPIFAIFKGATLIEKHITLDNNDDGPDHKASLDIKNFEKMVLMIRNYSLVNGSKIKRPNKEEIKNSLLVRKSIVAKRKIKKGEKFTDNNLTCKRPGNGMQPEKLQKLIGKISKKNYQQNQQIKI